MFDDDYCEEDYCLEEDNDTEFTYSEEYYKPVGKVSLTDVNIMTYRSYKVLDLSEAEFGIEMERWQQILGYRCNFCPVTGRSGYRKVEVLKRLLEEVIAETVILPDDVCRRHINVIKGNRDIHYVVVGPDCRLFSMKDDALMNKKGTKLIFQPLSTTRPQDDPES